MARRSGHSTTKRAVARDAPRPGARQAYARRSARLVACEAFAEAPRATSVQTYRRARNLSFSENRRLSAQPTCSNTLVHQAFYTYGLLHSSDFFAERVRPQVVATPSSRAPRDVPLNGHAIMDWATQRRCQWAGWSHPVPQPTARQSLHAPKHVWLIHRVCVTRALGSRAQVEAAAVFGAPAVLLGLQGRLWCALCTGCAQEALRQRLR